MKKFGLIIGCLFLLAVTVSCKSTKPTVTNDTFQSKTIVETVHDTVFKVEKDSSYYQAYLECINGKVVVKNVTQAEPGRKLKSPKVRIDNNQLQVDCESLAEEKFAFWKSQQVVDVEYRINTITNYTNILTWWQKTQIYGFRVLAVLTMLLTALYLGRLYLKTKNI